MWKEGGVGKLGLHGLAGYLEGRVSGGPAGAAAFAAVSNEALTAAVNNAIVDAMAADQTRDPKNDAATAKAYGEAAATLIGSLAGALTGGTQGAAIGGQVALTADQNNRQLHPSEKTLAKQLAQLSGGKYTEEEIEAQMRGMDTTINGKVEYGIPDTVLDGKPAMDSDGTWVSGGGTVIVQALTDANPELRAFIVQNTTGASVPIGITYAGPYSAPPLPKIVNTLPIPTARCPYGAYDCAAGIPMETLEERQQRLNNAANFSGSLATQSGRISSYATAYGTYLSMNPSPVAQAGALAQYGIAGTATIVSFFAGGMEQLFRPNVGQYAVGGFVDVFLDGAANKFPLVGPIINLGGDALKESNPAKAAIDKINNAAKGSR